MNRIKLKRALREALQQGALNEVSLERTAALVALCGASLVVIEALEQACAALPRSEEEQQWMDSKAVGREIL